MKNKVVVVGSNGYLGKHLVRQLLIDNCNDLFLSDIQSTSFYNSLRYQQWDVTQKNQEAEQLLKDSHYIFFLGGLTGTIRSIEAYENFISVNEIGLLNMLDIVRKVAPHAKVIFPSTRLVYKGKTNVPLKEDDEKEFRTVYAINKFSCEQHLKIFQQCFNIRYSVFRICVPYGNLVDDNLSFGTISHFLNRAKQGQDVVVFGDGLQKRTFTHVSDVVRFLATGGLLEKTDNEVFNIGGPDHLSISEVAERIAARFALGVEFREWNELDRQVESGDTVFDGSKLEAIVPGGYQFTFDQWIKAC